MASRRTALYPSSPGFVVGLVTKCLGSGCVQYASRSVAGQCEPNATGAVLLVKLTLSLSMTKKRKGPQGPLGRAPPKGPSSVPPFLTGVVAGTEGSSLRRWKSGRGTAAPHCGSQDVSLEPSSVDQVVCGAGDGEPIARRWEKRPTRCDPKRGQRVGPQISWIETDRLDAEFDA